MSSNAPINNDYSEGKSKSLPLPLGWTQVKRKRTPKAIGESSDVVDWCCDDPSCPRPSQRPKLSLAELPEEKSLGDPHTTTSTFRGHAIFCMPDVDPTWVQGYFQVDGIKNPWGLLAVTEELDECLQCVDGGYRRVTLTVFPFSRKKVSWNSVNWTGGDMMRLEGESVSMEPNRMWTGTLALPYVHKYFMKIIQKLRDPQRNNDNDGIEQPSGEIDILEMLPNIAVVMGPMTLKLENATRND
jgi:hypothetical protein